MALWLDRFTNLFPLWALVCGCLALYFPTAFTWFNQDMIVWGLGIIMLGMGMTLSVDDFKKALAVPRTILAGFVAQYLIMPFLGWAIARALHLETSLAVGLILVACCPGGTASNVVCYIARASVPLSVLMTTATTFGAVFMTPLLTKWLAGTLIPVSAAGLFFSTVKVVLLPVLFGLALHHGLPRVSKRLLPAAPVVSVIFIVLIVSSVIGQNAADIRKSGLILLLAVFLLHSGGFALGYFFGKILGYDEIVRRTIAIEVGMQNSGLGVVLATRHFPGTLAPVPCAISAVFHSIIGSCLAGFWRQRPPSPSSIETASPSTHS